MFYIRDEGEPVRNGFNFYPFKSTNSVGVVIRLNKHAIWLRYSKLRRKLFCSLQTEKRLNII